MKDWIKELCPEIADWQAELIAEHCQPKREWQGLTDEEKNALVDAFYGTDIQRLEAIETKLKELNT